MRGQSGQATFEWIGLVLMAALTLGALGMFWTRPDGREQARAAGLGEAVAERITCAAKGSCAMGRVPGGGGLAPA